MWTEQLFLGWQEPSCSCECRPANGWSHVHAKHVPYPSGKLGNQLEASRKLAPDGFRAIPNMRMVHPEYRRRGSGRYGPIGKGPRVPPLCHP